MVKFLLVTEYIFNYCLHLQGSFKICVVFDFFFPITSPIIGFSVHTFCMINSYILQFMGMGICECLLSHTSHCFFHKGSHSGAEMHAGSEPGPTETYTVLLPSAAPSCIIPYNIQ